MVSGTNVNLIVDVKEQLYVDSLSSDFRKGLFRIQDESGEISMILWGNAADLVEQGDRLFIENAFVRDWNGKKRITPGKNGIIRRVSI